MIFSFESQIWALFDDMFEIQWKSNWKIIKNHSELIFEHKSAPSWPLSLKTTTEITLTLFIFHKVLGG